MSIVVEKQSLSSDAALDLVRAAIAYGRSKGWEIAAAVCDPFGHLLAFHRTDGVAVPPIEFAIDKAYTAATMRRSTRDLFTRAESRPALKQGLTNRERLLVFPGGLPVVVAGTIVGGIGVSGATDDEDVECAEAALRAVIGEA